MAELKYSPVTHDHKVFLARAGARRGFKEAYDALELEYELASQLLKSGQAQVSKNGIIRLFGRDDEHGALEFVKDEPKGHTARFREVVHGIEDPGERRLLHFQVLLPHADLEARS